MNAAAFPFVTDGIPYVYYGQEQGFSGGNDPENREVSLPPCPLAELPAQHTLSLAAIMDFWLLEHDLDVHVHYQVERDPIRCWKCLIHFPHQTS